MAEWYSGCRAFTDPIGPRRGRGVSPHCKGQYKVALSHIAHVATTNMSALPPKAHSVRIRRSAKCQ